MLDPLLAGGHECGPQVFGNRHLTRQVVVVDDADGDRVARSHAGGGTLFGGERDEELPTHRAMLSSGRSGCRS